MVFFDFFKANKKSTTNRFWKHETCKISDNLNAYFDSDFIGQNFYVSSYGCPYCDKALYKTVFPIGKEYPINTNNNRVNIKRVFTCPSCKSFFAASPGQKIANGKIYTISYLDKNDYLTTLYNMDSCGTTQGRPDL